MELYTMAIQRTTSSAMFATMSNFMHTNSKHVSMFFSFLVLVVAMFFAHKLWMIKKERSAQYDFSALMTEYEAMSREKDPQWSLLLEKFNKTYADHASSPLLPYYLGYKVQILLEQDKKDDALATLDRMITSMTGSPMIALYQMEQALIQLDSVDSEINNVGLESLKSLAQDTDNMFRDSAQYYLGRYYWANNQIDNARAVWQQLVDEQRDQKLAPSPWVNQVQEHLALTIV